MTTQRILLKARLILVNQGKVLLMKQTTRNGGNYTLPGGTVEDNEFALRSLVRECLEETGLRIEEKDLELVHTLHKKKEALTRIVLYFRASEWEGFPVPLEPKKFKKIEWFEWTALPEKMSPTVRHVLVQYNAGSIYSEYLK